MKTPTLRRPRVRHKLTRRDYAILEFIAQDRYHCREKIRVKFWPGRDNNHHHRRLRVLLRMGFIYNAHGEPRFGVGFRLTKEGQNELANFTLQCDGKLASCDEPQKEN